MEKKAYRIVLADDEKFISKAYKEGLTREGFTVTVADDGLQALAAIETEKPDLVLLDLIMPGMTGFEVLKSMKAKPELQNIPVLILSNLSQETDREEALSLGAQDFLVKADASLDDVVNRVNQFFQD